MLFKSPKSRQFSYQPRYYKPTEDEDDIKSRIKFKRLRSTQARSKGKNLRLILLIALIAFMVYYFYQSQKHDDIKEFDNIEIEEMR